MCCNGQNASSRKRNDAWKIKRQASNKQKTRTAASAAWWLFGTAIVSALCSAVAGAIAVAG